MNKMKQIKTSAQKLQERVDAVGDFGNLPLEELFAKLHAEKDKIRIDVLRKIIEKKSGE